MTDENAATRGGSVDKLTGKVKEAAGNLAGNRDLAEEGKLQQARATEARRAGRLDAAAEQAADEARVDAELQATAVEQAEAGVALDEAERLDEIDRQQGADQARTRASARSRREELDHKVAAEEAALDRRERGVEAGAAAAEARAEEIHRRAAADAQAAATLAATREAGEGDDWMMQVTQIPRKAIQFGLWGARLPLTLAERVLARGQEDTSTWPPNLAFDKVEAGVKDVVGRATRDDTLVTAARLQRAEITRLESARAARVHATKVVDDAEAAAQARREELDGQREAVETAAAEGERRIEEAQRDTEQRAAKEAEAKRSATRTTAAKRRQAVDKQATRTDMQRARSQGEALRTEKAAVRARGKALELDAAVQAKKSSRRSR
jgi:uncharacterized protein YjbJ (UPF0337 family)